MPIPASPRWRPTVGTTVLMFLLAVALTAALHGTSLRFGLASDDYQWIDEAHHFDSSRLWSVTTRSHFFRPGMDAYFYAAASICGHDAPCFHAANLAAHAVAATLVFLLIASLTETTGLAVLAALVFIVQPAPVEALGWVSAVTEILVTAAIVLAIFCFHRAEHEGGRGWTAAGTTAGALALLTHESAVMTVPLAVACGWLMDPSGAWSTRVRRLAPLTALTSGYLVLAYVINSRNYVVTEGHYAIGLHAVRHLADALASFTVSGRAPVTLVVLSALLVAALFAAPRPMRVLAAWIVLALLPFAFFRNGLPSRYLYLASVGASGLIAWACWWLRSRLDRWGTRGRLAWLVVIAVVLIRFAAFAERNMRVQAQAAQPFVQYAGRVLEQHPNPPRGVPLEAPDPSPAFLDIYVQPLLRWAYRNEDLVVRVRDGNPAAEAPGASAQPGTAE